MRLKKSRKCSGRPKIAPTSPGTKPVKLDAKLDWNRESHPLALRDSNFFDILLWLLRQRQRFRVVGVSMLPVFLPGDEVFVDPNAYKRSPPTPGDAIALVSPDDSKIRLIKRVVSVRDNGTCFVLGDNPSQSTDSRSFGWVQPHLILGRVTCRFG